MKKSILTLLLSLAIISLGYSQQDDVSGFESKLVNWHLKDISGRIMGTNTEKAYKEILVNRTPKKKIIVAVIDAGIDIYHEDLRENIWINTGEIKGNGIDDDNNGYIDDINGWNFLGNSKGENIENTTLEKTRVLKELAKKYGTGEEYLINEKSTAENELYLKIKAENKRELDNINKELPSIKTAKKNIENAYAYLSKLSGQPINTIKDVEDLEPIDKEQKKIRKQLLFYSKMGVTKASMEEYETFLTDQIKAHLNLNFNPREDIIGDNLNDITDNKYGNPNVIGPDAFHGTFCAGIIGGIRNNDKGINGIANNVLIMPIRAVPNGDEYDKDIALAIRYAVDNGAQIINMSFGKSYSPNKQLVDEAFAYAESKGVLLIHAAGNDNKNIDFTANFPTDSLNSGRRINNLICVGASTISTKKRLPADFSNYGNKNVDVFAPGMDVISTTVESQYEISQGTSFSAPVVSGVCALIWSYYPDLTAVQMKEIIIKSATSLGKKKVLIPGTKSKVRFKELSVSDGVVNTYKALLLAEEMMKS